MARPGYSAGSGVRPQSLVATLAGMSLVTFAAGSVRMLMPQTGKIVGISLNIEARGGTHSTSTLDVLKGATSLLGATFNVASQTAAAVASKEGSALAAAADLVAKDTEIVITTAESGGTSPTWRGVTVQIDYVPVGD